MSIVEQERLMTLGSAALDFESDLQQAKSLEERNSIMERVRAAVDALDVAPFEYTALKREARELSSSA